MENQNDWKIQAKYKDTINTFGRLIEYRNQLQDLYDRRSQLMLEKSILYEQNHSNSAKEDVCDRFIIDAAKNDTGWYQLVAHKFNNLCKSNSHLDNVADISSFLIPSQDPNSMRKVLDSKKLDYYFEACDKIIEYLEDQIAKYTQDIVQLQDAQSKSNSQNIKR